MSLKLNPLHDYELHRIRLDVGMRVKRKEIEIDHESAPIHLDIQSSFAGGVKQQLSVIESIVSKIYAADIVELRHSTVDITIKGETVTGGAVITIKDLTIFRSVIAKFSIKYKKIHDKAVKIYELLDITIV